MTHRRQSRWLVVVLVAVLCRPPLSLGGAPLAAGAADSRMVSLAEAVPADAWFFAAMTLDRSGSQAVLADQLLDRTGIGRLIDQSMATDPSWAQTERDLVAYDAFLHRDMAVFVTPQAIAGQLNAATSTPAAGAGLIVRVADPVAAASLMASVGANAAGRVVHGAVAVNVEPPSTSSTGSAWALLGDLVVVGIAPEDVFGVIDVVRGGAPSLAARPAFGAATAVLPSTLLAAGFYDVGPLREQIADIAAASAPGLEDQELAALDLMLPLGARGGFGLWADPAGFRLAFTTSPATGERGSRPVGADLASAASVLMITGHDLGKNPVWRGWLAAADRYAAAFGNSNFASELPTRLGFDPIDDLLARLTGDWVVTGVPQFLATPPIAFTLVSGTDDPARLASTLDTIAGLLIEQAKTPSSQIEAAAVVRAGQSIHRVAFPFDNETGSVAIEYGVVGDRVAVTVGRPLDAALRPPAQPLTTNPRYQTAMAMLPPDRSTEAFVDLAPLLPMASRVMAAGGMSLPTGLRADGFAMVATVRDGVLVTEAVLTIPE